jgi:hypothetical protein
MRSLVKTSAVALGLCLSQVAMAQQPELQFFRQPGQDGLNVFEIGKKADQPAFEGLKVRVGGDFALQYQFLQHSADMNPGYRLVYLGNSVNLPTANLNLDAQLAKGMRVHLRTYLSSRHHNESWVKGGYIQIDNLDFIKEGLASGLMDIMTVKAGVDNFSYGDAVYRRTDNAMAIYNPFVGNYLMDNNTVEPFLELQFFPGDFIALGGIGTGILNPTVIRTSDDQKMPPAFWAKLGWDSQVNEDLRVRLTGSIYNAAGYDNGFRIYGGDRAGARYYKVFDFVDTTITGPTPGGTNDFSGRVNPNLRKLTAFQINPFVKWQGLEFFGVFEVATGFAAGAQDEEGDWEKGNYTQLGAELLYRFGKEERFYVGGRFNSVTGNDSYRKTTTAPDEKTVNRINVGGGWFMTKNVLAKVEYVTQTYNDAWTSPSGNLTNGNFNGFMLEAVIGF